MVRQVRFLVTVEEIADSGSEKRSAKADQGRGPTARRRTRTAPVKASEDTEAPKENGMRLHDLRPAEGSRKERIRVGRGIAAGKGKTAGRGTKGQKARAGGSIPAWFEGGQTPLHMRIPKLRGFKNRFKIEYEIVNVGAIAAAAERGAFETEAADAKPTAKTKGPAQITVNQDILRAVGLVRSLNKPLKILGNGELSTPLFVVADAFTASARDEDRGRRRHGQRAGGPDRAAQGARCRAGEERTPAKQSRGAQAATAQRPRAREARAETAEAAAAEAAAPKPPKPPKASKAEAAASTDAEPPAATAEAERSRGDCRNHGDGGRGRRVAGGHIGPDRRHRGADRDRRRRASCGGNADSRG